MKRRNRKRGPKAVRPSNIPSDAEKPAGAPEIPSDAPSDTEKLASPLEILNDAEMLPALPTFPVMQKILLDLPLRLPVQTAGLTLVTSSLPLQR